MNADRVDHRVLDFAVLAGAALPIARGISVINKRRAAALFAGNEDSIDRYKGRS